MKELNDFFREKIVLFIITIISAIVLCVFSYLIVLEDTFSNEEQCIMTINSSVLEEIETSLRYGKRLSNYYGISRVLKNAEKFLPPNIILTVEDSDGNVLAATEDKENFIISLSDYGVVRQDIHGGMNDVAGVLATYYMKESVRNNLTNSAFKTVIVSAFITVLTVLCCAVLGVKMRCSSRMIIAATVIGIIVQGIFLTFHYKNDFEIAARKSAESVAHYVTSSINAVINKGIVINEIADIENYLGQKRKENQFIKDIYFVADNVNAADNIYIEEIEGSKTKTSLVCEFSEEYIRKNVLNMLLIFAATIILIIIAMNESFNLSKIIAFRKSHEFNTATIGQFDVIAKAIRYGNFLSLTFDYMCLSFSALQIKEWNEGVLMLSPTMTAALSLSLYQAADLLGLISMPSVSRHIKMKNLSFVSTFLVIVANIICFVTKSAGIMILMRFFAGIGTAGIKQTRNMIISRGYSNEAQRNANLIASNNGIIGGLLCGMGLGGVAAAVFGYQTTFLISGFGYLLYLCFETECIPWKMLERRAEGTLVNKNQESLIIRMLSIFKSMNVWHSILTILVPQYFLLMMIVCLIPGRIHTLKLSGVVLTYANLLNGIAGLYIGEWLCGLLKNKLHSDLKIEAVVLFTGGITMFIMNIPVYPVAVMIFAAFLAGLLDGVGTPVATDIFMGNAHILLRINDVEILMLYSVIGSVVMSTAPFLMELCEKNFIYMYSVGIILMFCALSHLKK